MAHADIEEASAKRRAMMWLAYFVGLIVAAIGILGMAAPMLLLDTMRLAQSQAGLYVVAALRIAFGLALLGAAAASRLPRTLRVLGVIFVVAGIISPFFGVERIREILDWWSAQGPLFMRVWAVFPVLLGLFIVYAATPRRAA